MEFKSNSNKFILDVCNSSRKRGIDRDAFLQKLNFDHIPTNPRASNIIFHEFNSLSSRSKDNPYRKTSRVFLLTTIFVIFKSAIIFKK